jgi:hypothetical protein
MELLTDTGKINIEGLPDQCPFCHRSIIPKILFGHRNNNYLA